MRAAFLALLWVTALASIGNGLWMLAHAWSWFTLLPGVIDTGAVNSHFIHDVGTIYLLCGMGLIWCARNLPQARVLYLGITAYYASHALGHVAEILLGQLPASHWWIDAPLLFAPALALGFFALPGSWRKVAA